MNITSLRERRIVELLGKNKSKKTLFDILHDNSLITDANQDTSKINILMVIDVLHGFTTKNPTPTQRKERLRQFKKRSTETILKEGKNRFIISRYSPEQQLELSKYLKDLGNNIINAAKQIKDAANKDPNQKATVLKFTELKKNKDQDTDQIQSKSIFGNIIK